MAELAGALEVFVGKYMTGVGRILNVTLQDGVLHESGTPLQRATGNTFAYPVNPSSLLNFELGEDGQVKFISQTFYGNPIKSNPISDGYAKWVGNYLYSEEGPLVLQVSEKEGALHARLSGQPSLPLEQLSENIFQWDPSVVVASVTFHPTEAVHHQNGNTIRAQRLADVTADASIAGRYDYGSATMVFSAEGDKFFACLGDQAVCEIFPLGTLTFYWMEASSKVVFEKGPDGAITHARHQEGSAVITAPRLAAETP